MDPLAARRTALALAIVMLVESLLPASLFALSSGPAQPEFSRFEAAGISGMVNPFTGDFTYNLPVLEVPGANGGGYALSLSYHSGLSPEDEASWVGYGWTLNPGAITRNKRGFADDSEGHYVKYWNRVPANRTVSLGGNFSGEAFSFDLPASGNVALRYNNYKGFGYSAGLGLQLSKGLISLGYGISDGEGRFSAGINPGAFLSKRQQAQPFDQTDQGIEQAAMRATTGHYMKSVSYDLFGSDYGAFSYAGISRPTAVTAYKGTAFNFSASVLAAASPLQAGPSQGLTGSYSVQENTGKNGVAGAADSLKTFGYMYSGSAGPDDMMDYYVEKGGSYEKNDRFLGVPFSNADNFSVTGEGLGGGFRLHHRRPGHFHPNHKKSTTTIHNIGGEVELGVNVGGGVDVGQGEHTLEVTGWTNPGNTGNFKFDTDTSQGDEPYFFRFNNDQGGSVRYADDDAFIQGDVEVTNNAAGNRAAEVDIPSQVYGTVNEGQRSGRSSYIAYHTNAEMSAADPVTGKKYKAYCRDATVNSCVKRDGGASNPVSKGIGEFAVFNESGDCYVYGLPVYARNELNLQYDLKGAQVRQNYLAYKDISADNDLSTKVGEERPAPYAESFLLTQITSPDYIDRGADGPTPDDHGAYTKFNYRQHYGTPSSSGSKAQGSNWYRWRAPFTGLLYERNSMSDPNDDMGTVMAGEKEIYYLESIETKTHIAYFITGSTNTTVNGILLQGSGQARKDGIEAAANVTAANDSTARGIKTLQKLERIELYAKDANGLPSKKIRTVNFAYDYSLCTGVPNNIDHNPANPNASQTGKLTLKKVWFDDGDVMNAKISPYVFEYTYPQSQGWQPGYLPGGYPQPYAGLCNYAYGSIQNPAYDPFNVNAWGDYQYGGKSRYEKFMRWLDQRPAPPQFDPAAWHLKVVRMPSGGELHVQYEQKTYSYVQDRRAMGMVPLLAAPAEDKFYLDTSALGISSTAELQKLEQLIEAQFITKGERIYFKFYYKLLGPAAQSVLDGSCNGEFITGYAKVTETGIDQQGIYVKLQGGNELPRNVCRDFVRTQRAGKSVLNGNCNASDGVDLYGDEPLDIVMSFSGFLAQLAGEIPGTGLSTCAALSLEDSYLRVPLTRPKKGGGVRVKRLLLFDAGIEAGDKNLYGTEFIYDVPDPVTGELISSGVATTEPQAIREENALVGFMDRFRQSFIDKVISGRDKETTEGPVGESILPAPSIGYGKVIAKNIFSGKSNAGFVVHEHFTARDYPFDRHYGYLSGSAFDFTTIEEARDWLVIPAGLVNFNLNNLWLSQGFRFVLNNMHGQPKATATYGGNYNDPSTWMLSSKSEYTYYEPGEKIPVQRDIHQAPVLEDPGKEMEVVFEIKAVEDILKDVNVEGDADVGLIVPPIPFFSLFPSVTYSEARLRTHVTSNVIRYPAIVKSVREYADGRYATTYNGAFSPYDGKPLVTLTTDGYHGLSLEHSANHNGTYRSLSLPAADHYPELRGKYLNERLVIRSQSGNDAIGKMVSNQHVFLNINSGVSTAMQNTLKRLVPGDLVALYNAAGGALDGVYHVAQYYEYGKPFELLPTTVYKYNSGAALTNVNIEVLRSGRTNQPGAAAGSISTYGLPQPANSATHSMPGVLSASAVLMSDKWSYDTLVFGAFPQTLPSGVTNKFETGERGKFRVVSSFAYSTSVRPGNNELLSDGTRGRTYNEAGVLNDFTLFNWADTSQNNDSKWIAPERVLGYAPSGEAIASRNILNIDKAVKLGYHQALVTLSATNAAYDAVQFESFENTYLRNGGTFLEDGLPLPSPSALETGVAHSGSYSFRLNGTVNSLALKKTIPSPGSGQFIFRLWLKEDNAANANLPVAQDQPHPHLRITFDAPSGLSALTPVKIAQTGEWSLYEATLTATPPATGFTPSVSYAGAPSGQRVWIDDVRVQPREAQVSAYVYDTRTLRLLTTFDDQHFGTYYQYSSEGRLLRHSIETVKGRRTIREAQTHLPAVNRN